VAGESVHGQGLDANRRAALLEGQQPFATVICCSDSRVPPEHVFDLGLGEVFVCRIAGNILTEIMLGSVEYAAVHAGSSLVCVLGHSSCGACAAAVSGALKPVHSFSAGLDEIECRLAPAILDTVDVDPSQRVDSVAWKNVQLVCCQILQRSRILEELHRDGRIEVVGMYYDLASGEVQLVVPIQEEPREA